LSIEETVEISPGLFGLEYAIPTRSDRPIPIFSSRLPTRIRINGTLEVKIGTTAVPPVGKDLARYAVPGGIRIERSVRKRSGTTGDTEFEKFRYSLEFLVPFEVTMEKLLEERRALSADSFLSDESESSGFQSVDLSGSEGVRDPQGSISSPNASDPRAGLFQGFGVVRT